MAEKEEVTYVPVSIEEVCDYKGFLVEEVEEDKVIKRNIIRLINFSNLYLQGAIGKNYPTEDERAKQIALLVISDLYDYRDLDSKNISNTTRKILNDLEWQLKMEMRKNGGEKLEHGKIDSSVGRYYGHFVGNNHSIFYLFLFTGRFSFERYFSRDSN